VYALAYMLYFQALFMILQCDGFRQRYVAQYQPISVSLFPFINISTDNNLVEIICR
jgi:hypothetical protein